MAVNKVFLLWKKLKGHEVRKTKKTKQQGKSAKEKHRKSRRIKSVKRQIDKRRLEKGRFKLVWEFKQEKVLKTK